MIIDDANWEGNFPSREGGPAPADCPILAVMDVQVVLSIK